MQAQEFPKGPPKALQCRCIAESWLNIYWHMLGEKGELLHQRASSRSEVSLSMCLLCSTPDGASRLVRAKLQLGPPGAAAAAVRQVHLHAEQAWRAARTGAWPAPQAGH